MSATAQPGAGVGEGVASARASFRETLARPLAPYYLLLGATGLLLAIGLVMVLTASSVDSYEHHGNSYYWATKQLMWVGVGLPCAWVATRLPLRLLRFAAWPMLLVSIALLALTQTSLGVEVNGNKNWLGLGPLQIQPSEIAKFALILWCADVYARKDHLLDSWRHLAVPVLPVAGLVCVLVLAGGDLGTALVLFAITLGLFWVVGVPARIFVAAVSVVSVGALYLAASSPERLNRITSFVNPFNDFQNSGWQAGHGILGMASGGIFGKGIGASQQKWGNLPEAHTDFIFAVLGEELGLVGTLLVLALFLALAYAGLRVAVETQDLFVRYASAGIVIWLMAHVVINIGMVLALLPVIGIPLPLVSYGGSSLVPELVALGLVIGFARTGPDAAAELHRRRRARRAVNALSARPAAARPAAARPPPRGAEGRGDPREAGPARGRGHGRAHLAAARDRRRPAPPAPRPRGHRAGHRARSGDPRRPRCRLPARAGPAGAAVAASGRRPAAHAAPAARRGREALAVLDRVRPDVVVGFGGYVSVPAYLAARRRRVPLVVHEGNALPGVANRLGARLTPFVATSFPDTGLPHAAPPRAADAPDDRDPGPGGAPRGGPGGLRPRPRAPDPAGHRGLPGRPAA